ncbi:ATP-binding protein [Nonomuraea zeae]|uniref:ATP-binding protein n=1 Tax=Nonomuraea zeae TaxID=1642303 RepID=UPI001478FE16|nr:LuxR C-terminal-related transcriptional regulator [Nonomuraea zeae]
MSKRETEVLALVGAQLSNAEIAAHLHLSVRTVENHVSSLLRKCGVADRRELGRLARQDSSEPGRITGLPAPLTTFIGRAAERERLLAALRAARLVTLVGPGGVGKTRLAIETAGGAQGSFPGGGAFVDLVPVGEAYVAQAVAAALGVTERPDQHLHEAIAERLGDGGALLILDNCEHVIDAVARFAEQTLRRCPGTRILATSRERLGVPGERALPLAPFPPASATAAPVPLTSHAELLFLDRATAADPGFTADPATLTLLCARLDGMPLAIELAAARVPALGADGLFAALDDHLRLLAGGRGADERHRSLRAVIGWSHELLDEEERALFRRLAVFAGPFDLDAVVAVTPGLARSAAADVLGRLADKSLLAVHRRSGAARWRLLETVRAYAAERLDQAGETDAARRLHLEWAAGVASALEAHLETADRWRDGFDAVADDLRAALAWAPDVPGHLPYRLAGALGHLTYARRFLGEALGHYLTAARLAPTALEAVADLRAAADCTSAIGDVGRQPLEMLLEAVGRARETGDGDLTAIALASVVSAACRHHVEFEEGVPHAAKAELLAEARAAGDPANPVVAAHLAAAAAWLANEHAADDHPADVHAADDHPETETEAETEAEAAVEAAVEAARTAGDPVLVCAALDIATMAALRRERRRQACHVTSRRLSLLESLPRHVPAACPEIVDTLRMAFYGFLGVGDLPAALAVARQAMDDDLVGGSYLAAAHLITPLVLTGRFDEALSLETEVWEGWRRTGRPFGPQLGPPIGALSLAHGLRGDGDAARLWRSRALNPPHRRRYSYFMTFADARLALHHGRFEQAAELVEAALVGSPTAATAPYREAVAAELAVAAGLPGAAGRLAATGAGENDWAAACLARARGRLRKDENDLSAAVALWERIDARFERACTLLLLPGRADEGASELAELGCVPPKT